MNFYVYVYAYKRIMAYKGWLFCFIHKINFYTQKLNSKIIYDKKK